MKAFYKELLKREGGKRNLTAADVSEIMKHAAEMISNPHDSSYLVEFEKYLAKTKKRQVNLKKTKVNCIIAFRSSL